MQATRPPEKPSSVLQATFDAFGTIGCSLYVGGAAGVALFLVQQGGARISAGLPIAALVAAAVATVLTLIRCGLTGFYLPLTIIGCFVGGLGVVTTGLAPLDQPASHGILHDALLRLEAAIPWAFLGVCMLSLWLACITPRER